MRVALLAGPATAFRLAEYSPLDFLSFGGSDSDAATEADVAGGTWSIKVRVTAHSISEEETRWRERTSKTCVVIDAVILICTWTPVHQ